RGGVVRQQALAGAEIRRRQSRDPQVRSRVPRARGAHMIEKSLTAMFKVVTDEAANNPAFGKRLEDSLATFGQELADKRLAERTVGDFHPFIEYKKGTPAEFEAKLAKFDAKELRVIIDKHHLDPANTFKGKGTKKALASHIAEAARKRAER